MHVTSIQKKECSHEAILQRVSFLLARRRISEIRSGLIIQKWRNLVYLYILANSNNIITMKKILSIFTFCLLLTSCDRSFLISGEVLDQSDGKPISNAKVFSSEMKATYTDSLGKFIINRFGPGSMSDKKELLVEKQGYKSKYIDLSSYHSNLQDIKIRLITANQVQKDCFNRSYVFKFYIFNLIFTNLLAIFTLGFIIIKKVKFRWYWVLLILCINIVLKLNWFNGTWDIDIVELPFFLKDYIYYYFTIKIVIPLSIIVFWILFFTKKDAILQRKEQ